MGLNATVDDRAVACCGRSGVLDLAALRALALCGVDAGDEAWRLEATRRWGAHVRRGAHADWKSVVARGERVALRLARTSGGVDAALAELAAAGSLPTHLAPTELAETLRAVRKARPQAGRALARFVCGDTLGDKAQARATTAAVVDRLWSLAEPAGPGLLEALRAFLVVLPFLPLASGRGADRLIRAVAQRYATRRRSSADVVYVLIYALIMLQTDLHNPRVRPKMSEADFVASLRRTIVGEEREDLQARELYRQLKARPLGNPPLDPAPALDALAREPRLSPRLIASSVLVAGVAVLFRAQAGRW